MLYCEKCRELREDACPKRGHSLREPRENDPVLLIKADRLQAGMLEDMLKQENIPLLKEGLLGAGMSTWTGGLFEVYSLYVPYGALERARSLIIPVEEDEVDEDEDFMYRQIQEWEANRRH